MTRKLTFKNILLPFILFSISITGCVAAISANTDLTISTDENWKSEVEVIYALEDVQSNALLISQSLNEVIAEMHATGIEASWQRLEPNEEGVPYVISAQGQGLGLLNQALLNNEATIVVDETGDRREIQLRYYPRGGPFSGVRNESYTLHAGEIIYSNGIQLDEHTVTWENPRDSLDVVFTEASDFSWTPVLLILLLGGVSIPVIIFLRRSNLRYAQPALSPTAEIVVPDRFCDNCGTAASGEARFCANCGNRIF